MQPSSHRSTILGTLLLQASLFAEPAVKPAADVESIMQEPPKLNKHLMQVSPPTANEASQDPNIAEAEKQRQKDAALRAQEDPIIQEQKSKTDDMLENAKIRFNFPF